MINWKEPEVYAVKHKNESIRAASRSGGVFTALSDDVLKSGGVVYGCALDEDFSAVHIRAQDFSERDRMRGSKYVQSKLGETFKSVRTDLEQGRRVLFSGTSCQVAGLKNFLNRDYSNLLCVDILCLGVPSPKIWREYMNWKRNKLSDKVVGVDFRNKKDFGWREHVETLELSNGEKINSKVFPNFFHTHNIIRPSCYECPFKSIMHPGDITIADYWGIEKAAPKFDDNKGVSLVLINNDKGNELFESVKNNIEWQRTKIEDSIQPALIKPFERPRNREKFWDDFNNKDFEYVARKYGTVSLIKKIKINLGLIKRKIFNKI